MRMIMLVVVLASGVAAAQARVQKRSIIFSDTVIDDAEPKRPGVDFVPVRKGATFENLIKIRGTFDDKLATSVDNVR